MSSSMTFTSIGVYSIKDKAADEFGPPFLAKTDAVAMRMYNRLLETEKVTSADYVVYHIGDFDPVTGLIVSGDPRVVVIEMQKKIEQVLSAFGKDNVEVVK